ncbi:SUKH-4 family immunity protein [Kitasatospora griseola]|uniref:SUKH-4 family immunity protein n=1 Tax=Kitasatospora griseola TaxID=2064 RepID=UPI0037FA0810
MGQEFGCSCQNRAGGRFASTVRHSVRPPRRCAAIAPSTAPGSSTTPACGARTATTPTTPARPALPAPPSCRLLKLSGLTHAELTELFGTEGAVTIPRAETAANGVPESAAQTLADVGLPAELDVIFSPAAPGQPEAFHAHPGRRGRGRCERPRFARTCTESTITRNGSTRSHRPSGTIQPRPPLPMTGPTARSPHGTRGMSSSQDSVKTRVGFPVPPSRGTTARAAGGGGAWGSWWAGQGAARPVRW